MYFRLLPAYIVRGNRSLYGKSAAIAYSPTGIGVLIGLELLLCSIDHYKHLVRIAT